MNSNKILEPISDKGFLILDGFNEDLNIFRNEIEKNYHNILNSNGYAYQEVEKYHNLNILDNEHKNLWTRDNRNFNQEIILESGLYSFLEKNLGKISFSSVVDKNNPDIFWRLVRPNKKDVGSIHADIWFWDINNWSVPKDKNCLKIWMLLSKNINKGLGVLEKSHLKDDWIYNVSFKDGLQKPEFDTKKNIYKNEDLETPFGSVVFFDYRLLHYGIYNLTDFSRISLEFTIYFNKS